ncbi:DUF1513 domain-containing protein [Tropicimonas sp. TH_r6]|uniref:DUF1513 domain-containing protein n=1 Tax=Tropicimonas sp. TH_r6 TaxID=3082085 RepID=UPI002954E1B5|nr:DUF1513 domain-containing protein [Tropicimonas sp. TH_r6]MDV7141470.1 DUF1513 domain-containing protein [Tropicimonas sp. TH_r6]
MLKWLAAGLGVSACRTAFGQPVEHAAYIGIETASGTNLSRAGIFSASGARLGKVPLDFRAHGMAEHGRRLVVFPRRPGDQFAVVDLETLEIVSVTRAPEGRHFYGHGAFTLDGMHLLVPENDMETLQGAIAIYSMEGPIRRLDRIDLPGAGPHEILRHPSRNLFHVALGGLETHPEYGRTALNLHDFRSQVVTLNLENGAIDQMGYWAGTEGISLRHMGLDDQERLYIGGQIASKARALGEEVIWVVETGRVERVDVGNRMRGYVSSVATQGPRAMLTSRTGGTALVLDGDRLLSSESIDGASAVALAPGLEATSGFTLLRINDTQVTADQGHEFDNHGHALLTPRGV